jgi:predicted DNA-binding protein
VATITCKIPDLLAARLEAVAERRGMSKSAAVREAIDEWLKVKREQSTLSAYDLMKDGCGVVRGGPRDLSWNKRHMDGYGRD